MEREREREEGGFVLLVLLAVLVPLLLVVGAFSVTMTSRSNELRVEMDEERALLAAEAGVDDAIFKGQTGALTSGVSFQRSLGPDLSYKVTPTYLGSDGIDNDGDDPPLADEPDEDVFQVVVTATSRSVRRRVAAYLGPRPLLPPLTAPVSVQNPAIEVVLKGTSLISGVNVNMNGTPAAPPAPAEVTALAIAPPGTVAHLESELTGGEANQVVGLGGSPSLGLSTPVDVPALVAQLQNLANLVLTNNKYTTYSFGNGIAGVTNIAYREGDVMFAGNSQGAGILVVNGDLEIKGTFRFDGVIVVTGDVINSSGTAVVYGAILQGPGGGIVEGSGTLELHYSSQAIALANSGGGQYVAFNGWQELAR